MPREFVHHTGDNIFPDGISAEEALNVLQEWILGDDYYVVDPITPSQVNVIIVHDILNKVSPEYRNFRNPKPKKRSIFQFFKNK